MNDIIPSEPIPLPDAGVSVRPATIDDVDFLDALQKKTTRQVGFMPRKQFEGKVAAGHVLIAEEVESCELAVARHASGDALATPDSQLATRRVGYLIGQDQYFKRDDVGIIYQVNVVPERRRSLVAATLLRAQFARSAYGCRLYCCWCAQDIEANRFWESMGFVAIAYRTGGKGRGARGEGEGQGGSVLAPRPSSPLAPRTHIFWQRRIRAGDESTPWWFPSLTSGGSIREDRIVLPIPPGTHWSEAKPVVLPGADSQLTNEAVPARRLPSPRTSNRKSAIENRQSEPAAVVPKASGTVGLGRLSFFEAPVVAAEVPAVVEKPKREKRTKQKHDPKLVAAARELRDRYLEHYNAEPMPAGSAKYDVARLVAPTRRVAGLLDAA